MSTKTVRLVELETIGKVFREKEFTIPIYAPPSVARERLKRFAADGLTGPSGEYSYKASIESDGFRFERQKTYRCQFPPVIIGKITQEDGYVTANGSIQFASSVVSSYLSMILWAVIGGAMAGFITRDSELGNPVSVGLCFGIFSAAFAGVLLKLVSVFQSPGWIVDLEALELILNSCGSECK